MRILLATSSVAIAAVLAYPATAQQAPAAASATPAQQGAEQGTPIVDPTTTQSDENEIVVIANSLRGAVEAPQPPVVELNEQDIASYGASSLADLVAQLSTETGSGRGRGTGRPVFLVNGMRVSSFREMMSYPPEAIQRVQVLPEEVAQRYGFPPDQRVINFILKDRYASRTVQLQYGQPFDGGTSTEAFDGTYLKIAGKNRLNFDLKLNHTTPLTEAERNIIQTTVPTFATDPDPAPFRTLVGKSSDYQLTGNWTHGIGDAGASLTVNGTAERSDSLSFSGLDTVFLTDPGGATALRTFGTDFPLASRTRTDTYSFGSTLNAHAGDWQLTGTIDASHADNTSKIDRQADTTALAAAVAAGTLALDTPITGIGYPGYDTAESKTDSASTKFTAIGHPIPLPAGDVSVTLDAGFDWNRINSTDTRNVGVATKLTRGDINGGVNLSVPITSRRNDVLAFLGDVTANFSGGLDHLSDFGTLKNWSAGLNWGPTEKLNLQASYIVRDAAPGLSQLGAPTVINYNVPVYDFTTGQTVLADVTTGGNPDLNPYESTNYDASIEWYLSHNSILAGELFYKDIGNYILQETRLEDHYNNFYKQITPYNISRPYNAGAATSKGFAVAYQQNLPFGFGILANYTYADAHGSDGQALPYNSKHQVSVSPFFEKGPVSLRGTYTWRSKYFTGIDRGDNMFVRSSDNLDVSATYNFTKYLGLTLSGMNLTDSQYYAYANTPLLPRGVYKDGRKFLATVNLNF